MDGLAVAKTSSITPFWHRIPAFFLYGLHPYVLILAATMAVAGFFLGDGLFSLVLYIIMIKYGAEALLHTMDGDLTPPKLNFRIINDNYQLPFKLLIVILSYFFFIDFLIEGIDSFILAMTIAIASQLLIPAIVTSLIVTDEIGFALNPIHWFAIPFRIGWGYLVMVIFLILFDSIEYAFTDILVESVNANLVAPLWMAMNTYFTAVMFHLMGYVVLQYHEELGHDAPMSDEDSGNNDIAAGLSSPLLEKFMEEGNVAAAVAELSSLIEENPQDMELRRRMYTYLRTNGEYERLKQYAPHYFGLLADRGRFSDAASVYLEAYQRGDPFHPAKAEHHLPVLKELRMRRDHKQAVHLAHGFHKRFPEDPSTPGVYLEMSQILSEEMARDDLAQQALNFIIKKFPGHELMPQAQQYLAMLQRLQQQQPATR